MMKEVKEETLEAFQQLLEIMERLREECPWDRKQTMESLRCLTLEEVYELSDAILQEDDEEVKKELGDLMLHIVFYARIGEEKGVFGMREVLQEISSKLIRRHPHIFGDVQVQGEEDVKRNWEQIKMKEGRVSVLSGVPNSLPAMIKAFRMQEKAAGVGFDWSNEKQVLEKVKEEYGELVDELQYQGNQAKIEQEFGDLLFSLINWARFLKINPEDALEKTNKKFMSRFRHIEKRVKEEMLNFSDMSLDEMDRYWKEAKEIEGK